MNEKIRVMQEGGRRLGAILESLLLAAKPGVSLASIDALATTLIKKAGGTPSFTTVSGYKWATCLCVNDVVVHGVPSAYVLKKDDMFTIDIGMLYKGFHTDTAWTKIFAREAKKERFLRVGEKALWSAIAQARVGNRIGHISRAIQKEVEGAGYSVMRTLIGHGVGRSLHEEPQVPGRLVGDIARTPPLTSGMTLAIEVIYAMGKSPVVYDSPDGWSIATRDHSLSAVFEHTIAVTEDEPLILTARPIVG